MSNTIIPKSETELHLAACVACAITAACQLPKGSTRDRVLDSLASILDRLDNPAFLVTNEKP